MEVFFVEFGMGIDLHGQDVTRAARRAVRDAIGRNSLPGMRKILPDGDLSRMKVHVTLSIPTDASQLDTGSVREELPYGEVTVDAIPGGMVARSHALLPEKGDRTDEVYVVIAQVEVGR